MLADSPIQLPPTASNIFFFACVLPNKSESKATNNILLLFSVKWMTGLPSNGTITVGANSTSAGQILSYYYTVLDDTFNARTLQSLSTTAGATMRNPYSNQYFPDFAKFVNYYGKWLALL